MISQSSANVPFSFTVPTSTFSLGQNKRSSISDTWKNVNTVVSEKERVSIPLFNIVDDNDSTQEKLAKVVAEMWNIKYGFINSTLGSLMQQFAKVS